MVASEIRYDLQPADIEAWYTHSLEHARHYRYNYWVGGFAVSAGLAIVANDYLESWAASAVFAILGFAIGYIVTRAAVRSHTRSLISEVAARGAGTQFGPHTMTIDATGLVETGPQEQHRHSWSAVRSIAESAGRMFVVVDGGAAYVIPKRAFASEDAMKAFRTALSEAIAERSA
jgi:hypothetical protein